MGTKRRGSAYSVDLRERVVAALEGGKTIHTVAVEFKLGEATVYRWKRLKRETGSLAPRQRGGGHPRAIDGPAERLLAELVAAKPDLTLEELVKELSAKGVSAGQSSVWRALRRLDLTLKKSLSKPRSASGRTYSGARASTWTTSRT